MNLISVTLLVEISREVNFGTIATKKEYHEMPEYKENYTQKEFETFIKNEFGETAKLERIGDDVIWFKYRNKDRIIHLKIKKALKIGNEYFKLERLDKFENVPF